ncbi:MAG: RNA polymerase sigma-70 factor [Marinifilaceae bacterium]
MKNAKEAILEQLCDGSRKSFEAFFKGYYQDLFLWAHSILKDEVAAEDVVQEFFLDFWQKKRYQHIQTNLHSYIFRAVKNSCLNYLQRESKLLRDIEHLDREAFAPKADPEVLDSNQEIYSAINQLPEKCKEVFMLCCVHGHTYNEAAEDLGISLNTVRTQMTRAFKFLREKLRSPYLFNLLFFHSGNSSH